jgi:anti-anti-sigma regulatory factor
VRGSALLIRGPQPQIRRLIEMMGVHKLPGVRLEGPSPALA